MYIIQKYLCKFNHNIGFFVPLHTYFFNKYIYQMKKFYLFTVCAAVSFCLQAAVFTSPGNGETWTMTKIAAQEESPVTVDETGKVFEVAENVIISDGDIFQMEEGITIKMAKNVEIDIEGTALMAVTERSLITAIDPAQAPKTFWIKSENATVPVNIENLDFEYCGLKLSPAFGANVNNCTFRYHQASTSNGTSALIVGGVGASDDQKYVVTGCTFEENKRSGIGGASNASVPVTVNNCVFRYNDSQNLNYPQINLTAGNPVIITENIIEGNRANTRGGGIVVADLLSVTNGAVCIIDGNTVTDNRFGISVYSGQTATISNNMIVNNNTETNPDNGGSAINITDAGMTQKTKIFNNHIEGSLWGVTIIGGADINLGRIDVPEDDPNYCIGNNVFINNGNNKYSNGFDPEGEFNRFDVYNNSPNTVYAQNNYWYVAQDASPRVSIYDSEDGDKGEVIYTPWAGTTATGISTVDVDRTLTGVKYYNLSGMQSSTPFEGVNIIVKEYNDGTKTIGKEIR